MSGSVTIPYVPGYLAFREAPLIFRALKRLSRVSLKESVLMINGHGIAHPRRFGIASHVGVVLDLPSIGVAEKLLAGEEIYVGGRRVVVIDNTIAGIVLENRKNKKKYYATIGHRVSLEDVEYYMRRLFVEDFTGSKPPYPIYLADTMSRAARKGQDQLLRWIRSNVHIFEK